MGWPDELLTLGELICLQITITHASTQSGMKGTQDRGPRTRSVSECGVFKGLHLCTRGMVRRQAEAVKQPLGAVAPENQPACPGRSCAGSRRPMPGELFRLILHRQPCFPGRSAPPTRCAASASTRQSWWVRAYVNYRRTDGIDVALEAMRMALRNL